MFEETGKCKLLLNTEFVDAEVIGNKIKTIEAFSSSGQKYQVSASVFIDCTGGSFVCRNVECEMMLGEESHARFGEPSAPEIPGNSLNAISLVIRSDQRKILVFLIKLFRWTQIIMWLLMYPDL